MSAADKINPDKAKTMRPVHWIEAELSQHYEDMDLTQGADLDRNGKIEGSERTDLNGDGNVDSAEWQKFMGNNKAALETLGGHFKTYYFAGSVFKPDNPIHDLLSIESELVSPLDVSKAYEKVEEIFRIVKMRLAGEELKPEDQLRIVYDSMKEVGIEFKNQDDITFIGTLNKNALDCDTSSFVVLAVSHELNWPVHLVGVPKHAFVRWDDGKSKKFNIDFGETYSDESYLEEFNISPDAIDRGVYMENKGYDDILSLFYNNRGKTKTELGRYEESIRDFDKAIELNPNFAVAYYTRGLAKRNLGRFDAADEDINKAVELDPHFFVDFENFFEKMLKDLNKAMALDSNITFGISSDLNNAATYYNRGLEKCKLGRYEEAIKDLDKAIKLDPNYAEAYNDRGGAKAGLGRYEEAIKDLDKAIKLDSNYTEAYNNRGGARYMLGKYKKAIGDYDKAIKLDPNDAATYYNRGLAKAKLGKHEESIRDFDKAIELDPNLAALIEKLGQNDQGT